MDGAGHSISEIKAVGYCLPTTENLRYDLHGRWNRNAKHGVQFEVEGFDEVIAHSKEGIVAYLSSGQIKGVGPKTAEKIFELFGLSTLEILDREPEKLLAVSGISKTKLKKSMIPIWHLVGLVMSLPFGTAWRDAKPRCQAV